MNIKDIKTEAPTEGDKLENIFKRQKELAERYISIELTNGYQVPDQVGPVDLDDPKSQWFLKDAVYRIVEELSEATNTLKNKPWKTTHVATDQMHFYEEVADAFHFFVEFCIWAGLDAETLYKIYFKKSEVNRFRQATDY